MYDILSLNTVDFWVPDEEMVLQSSDEEKGKKSSTKHGRENYHKWVRDEKEVFLRAYEELVRDTLHGHSPDFEGTNCIWKFKAINCYDGCHGDALKSVLAKA